MSTGYSGPMADPGTVLLIHGGLWEDTGADFFWRRTGVTDGLARRGFTVIAPDRLRRATDWTAEAGHIAGAARLAGDDGPRASPWPGRRAAADRARRVIRVRGGGTAPA